MAAWFGSFSFIILSALFGSVLGFGIAAFIQGRKTRTEEKETKNGGADKD